VQPPEATVGQNGDVIAGAELSGQPRDDALDGGLEAAEGPEARMPATRSASDRRCASGTF